MKKMLLALCLLFALGPIVSGAEYNLETLKEGPPTEGLAEPIAAAISPQGIKVLKGTNRTVCSIWLCKEWDVKAGFKPTQEVLYPFTPGQLIGVISFRRRGADFRDQTIPKGLFTLRYAQQPTDGNHEGTSPTRDFLVLTSVEKEKSTKIIDVEELNKMSAESIESEHPGMFCLQASKGAKNNKPSLRHDEDADWWILQTTGKAKSKDKTVALPLSLVVVGVADE